MNNAIAAVALLACLFGMYHAGRALGSKWWTGKIDWTSLRLAYFAGAMGWCGLFAAQGAFWGTLAVWVVALLYFLNCNHIRREGYALVVMFTALAASWWAYLKPVALVVAVGALAACAPIMSAKEAAAHEALDAAMAACHLGTVQTTVEATSTADSVNRFTMACRTHGAQAGAQ